MKMTPLQGDRLRAFAKSYLTPAVVKTIMMKIYDVNKYEILASDEIDTACTFFKKDEQRHYIIVGTNFHDYDLLQDEGDRQDLIMALLVHELGHTLFTEKDLEKVKTELDRHNLPFMFLNLCEDARIEYLIKKEIAHQVRQLYKFNWKDYHSLGNDKGKVTPEMMLFEMIYTEGSIVTQGVETPKVEEFYKRFLDAANTFEVIEIMLDWRDTFHNGLDQKMQSNIQNLQQMIQALEGMRGSANTPGGNKPGDGKGEQGKSDRSQDVEDALDQAMSSGEDGDEQKNDGKPRAGTGAKGKNLQDMIETSNIQENPQLQNQLIAASISYQEAVNAPEQRTDRPFKIEKGDNTTVEEASNSNKIFDPEDMVSESGIYKNELFDIEKRLQELRQNKKRSASTKKPSDRLNGRKLYSFFSNPGNTDLYRKKYEDHMEIQIPKLAIFCDLSSSMGGSPVISQRTIALALNRVVALQSRTEVHMIGTKVVGRQALHQTVKLPCDERMLMGMHATGGSEGIRNAITKNSKLIKEKEVLVFITDGQVHRNEISRELLAQHTKESAVTIGIYVGDPYYLNEEMHQWFDAVIVQNTALEVVESLVDMLRYPERLTRNRNAASSQGKAPAELQSESSKPAIKL
jgi:hypothetical protein